MAYGVHKSIIRNEEKFNEEKEIYFIYHFFSCFSFSTIRRILTKIVKRFLRYEFKMQLSIFYFILKFDKKLSSFVK